MSLYDDDDLVRATTASIVAAGTTVLQVFMLAPDEAGHVAELLELMQPPQDAVVLDAGSGVGAVASLMKATRPDLEFLLLNISRAQLDMSPPGFACIHGSIEHMPITSCEVDVVMFNYSIGHGHLRSTLAEAARVLRPGGVLFIYDFEGAPQDLDGMDYRVHGASEIAVTAAKFGLKPTLQMVKPRCQGHTKHMGRFADPASIARIFGAVSPLALRFEKSLTR